MKAEIKQKVKDNLKLVDQISQGWVTNYCKCEIDQGDVITGLCNGCYKISSATYEELDITEGKDSKKIGFIVTPPTFGTFLKFVKEVFDLDIQLDEKNRIITTVNEPNARFRTEYLLLHMQNAYNSLAKTIREDADLRKDSSEVCNMIIDSVEEISERYKEGAK